LRKKKLSAVSRQLSAKKKTEIKRRLDVLLAKYGPGQLSSDPLELPRRYADARDREAAALVCALFAYGNVTAMRAYLESLLAQLGPRPVQGLRAGAHVRTAPYRFQTPSDVSHFLGGLGRVLSAHGSLEVAFAGGAGDPEARLEAFARMLRSASGHSSYGLDHLMPLPSSGSACKRWRLFLRWVVRPDDGVDLGLWTCLRPCDLIMPVDVHVSRAAWQLGLTRRASVDHRFALEVTEALRAVCPEDPCKYDFALARPGILKGRE
jgi:uncharacterized protein (TIGR02757 family)